MNNKKISWFSAFRRVVPADYEQWLELMEAEGWHIRKIGQWSSIAMTFVRDVPRKYRYVYDMQAFPRKDYIATYEQFGWEFVGQMASAFIWRMSYEAERPEAFSDAESVRSRNVRNLKAASVSFYIFLAMPVLLAIPLLFSADPLSESSRLQLLIGMGFSALCALLMGLVLLKLKKNR